MVVFRIVDGLRLPFRDSDARLGQRQLRQIVRQKRSYLVGDFLNLRAKDAADRRTELLALRAPLEKQLVSITVNEKPLVLLDIPKPAVEKAQIFERSIYKLLQIKTSGRMKLAIGLAIVAPLALPFISAAGGAGMALINLLPISTAAVLGSAVLLVNVLPGLLLLAGNFVLKTAQKFLARRALGLKNISPEDRKTLQQMLVDKGYVREQKGLAHTDDKVLKPLIPLIYPKDVQANGLSSDQKIELQGVNDTLARLNGNPPDLSSAHALVSFLAHNEAPTLPQPIVEAKTRVAAYLGTHKIRIMATALAYYAHPEKAVKDQAIFIIDRACQDGMLTPEILVGFLKDRSQDVRNGAVRLISIMQMTNQKLAILFLKKLRESAITEPSNVLADSMRSVARQLSEKYGIYSIEDLQDPNVRLETLLYVRAEGEIIDCGMSTAAVRTAVKATILQLLADGKITRTAIDNYARRTLNESAVDAKITAGAIKALADIDEAAAATRSEPAVPAIAQPGARESQLVEIPPESITPVSFMDELSAAENAGKILDFLKDVIDNGRDIPNVEMPIVSSKLGELAINHPEQSVKDAAMDLAVQLSAK